MDSLTFFDNCTRLIIDDYEVFTMYCEGWVPSNYIEERLEYLYFAE